MIEINRIYNMDCLEGMKRIADKGLGMAKVLDYIGVKWKMDEGE